MTLGIMEEEKEAVFQELSENNGDCSPVLVVSSLFEQSVLLSAQVFNTPHIVEERTFSKHLLMANPK